MPTSNPAGLPDPHAYLPPYIEREHGHYEQPAEELSTLRARLAAAEKLAEAVKMAVSESGDRREALLDAALTAYREESK